MSGNNGARDARLRVALVFDDVTRPETTGVYCRRALGEVADVTHFHPKQLREIPRGGFDLYLGIDDGHDYDWPADLRPAAWWAIDTHIDFDRALRRSRQADYVFAAQRDGAEVLRSAGVEQATWLPLACDPEIHARQDVSKQYDVAFVGNVLPGPRTDLVRLIQQHFRNSFVGNAYFADMARLYSASRIVFNRSVKNDINMRVFEALACGSLLVTNDLTDNGQAELFRDGVHLVTYRDGEELLDKLRYYLRKPELCERIAGAGRNEVLAKHTYAHRMRDLLASVTRAGESKSTRRASEAVETRSVSEDKETRRVSEAAASAVKVAPTLRGGDGGRPLGDRLARSVTECQSYFERAGDLPRSRDEPPHTDPSYFEFARPELLALVPQAACRVLEVGCGAGRLGESIKRRQQCQVTGIELNPAAAERARRRLDRVIIADVEVDTAADGSRSGTVDFPPDSFDCLILGDVLEHLVDPEGFLKRARAWLTGDATVIASIPNVRHHSVIGSLLAGNWTYEPAGLLDNTHLRFFTRRAIEALFTRTGYRIAQLGIVPGPGYEEWRQQGSPCEVRLPTTTVTGLTRDEAEEFFVYQYLVTAELASSRKLAAARADKLSGRLEANDRAERASGMQKAENTVLRADTVLPKCLLLMVTYNRLEYTRLALESVLKLDYPNLHIVVWDNASTDGTVDYLRQRLSGIERARIVASPTNRGVVWPMNEVWWSDPAAELLAKVDNDTLVPPDLLTRLSECHARHEGFGVLSGFHFREEGEALAEDHRVKSFGGVRMLPQPYVGGCAVMIRRRTLIKLGAIECQPHSASGPVMDSGWTGYQQRLTAAGFINGYPWPPIHVEHMEDTRSRYCIRSEEHQRYKQALRGMDLDQFTEALCVWRPDWSNGEGQGAGNKGRGSRADASSVMVSEAPKRHIGNGRASPVVAIIPSASSTPRPLRFTQDFLSDFDQFDFRGPPFAFARFADGERAICLGEPIRGQDGWNFPGGASYFRDALLAALRFDDPGYFIGISDGCCDLPARDWYLSQIAAPLARVTFSNIFVNGNYQRFRQLDLSDMAVVASEGGDFWVPPDVMNSRFDIDVLVERLMAVNRPILVSAGPASCVIIHHYWQRTPPARRQTIIDVGSAIDERTKGRVTRQYQVPGTRTSGLICRW